jgi:hypothetical protein
MVTAQRNRSLHLVLQPKEALYPVIDTAYEPIPPLTSVNNFVLTVSRDKEMVPNVVRVRPSRAASLATDFCYQPSPFLQPARGQAHVQSYE